MKYKSGSRRRAKEYEKDILIQWKKNKTFEKSVLMRPVTESYVFYDGPPFITGVPHHGTLLSSIVKDAIPRYQTMKGKRVERRWGWDCHGLPAEVYTEKKLGISDRRDIGTKISIADYVNGCRDNMVQTGSLWEDTIDRIGRWVDFEGAYKTMDKNYMESVWWAFKKLYEKGKIYEGEKVLMYCTRDATPLSKAEVTMDSGAYHDVTDPSVFVKFKLRDDNRIILAWTTTPWTLPANTALAINKDIAYCEVKYNDQIYIVSKNLVKSVFVDNANKPLEYEIIGEIEANSLIGLSYNPLFDIDAGEGNNNYKIWNADFVTEEDGTGIVHIAPAYGEDDFNLAKKNHISVLHVVDESGFYNKGDWIGKNIWENNKLIAKSLLESGIVFRIKYIKHSYPFCHRCGTRLMYRAHPSWFMDIEGQKEDMLSENSKNINWFPDHLKHGRFEKNIEQAPDWNLSRDRFWATAMPVWEGADKDGEKHRIVIGSYDELKELSGIELKDYHRPWIDDVEFDKDGIHYKRIDKVLDGWFESGSMPFAQFHYPFENVEKFEKNFPGDFIAEYIGQVRAWFYYLHAISVGLFGHNAFKNVIVTGTVAGNDGRKMSKSYGNYTDPNVLMDQYSADSLRLLLLSSPLLNGEDFALLDKDVADIARKLGMIWNMYDFFTMYAEVDGWEFDGNIVDPIDSLKNPLDIWIVSRVHQLNKEIESGMDGYDISSAVKPILPFIDDASNWYVRRSRRRFWKSGDDDDKNDAYRTLHYVLTILSIIIAPFTPFLSEELYQKMTGGESVHLLDWPEPGRIDEMVIQEMAEVREYVAEGLSVRARNHIKVRQPLHKITIPKFGNFVDYVSILKDEINVKDVVLGSNVELDVSMDDDLKVEGTYREIVRYVQALRKEAGLNIDDRIRLGLVAEDKLVSSAIKKYTNDIKNETLATVVDEGDYSHKKEVNIDSAKLFIAIEKIEGEK
jgi:isoleucyl-tRNA synthetase